MHLQWNSKEKGGEGRAGEKKKIGRSKETKAELRQGIIDIEKDGIAKGERRERASCT